ncbi:MAG: hypothetical protein ACO3JG_01900 [Luteolibacter sp.]
MRREPTVSPYPKSKFLAANVVTTDGSGNATVQFDLGTAKPATFIRAESAP